MAEKLASLIRVKNVVFALLSPRFSSKNGRLKFYLLFSGFTGSEYSCHEASLSRG